MADKREIKVETVTTDPETFGMVEFQGREDRQYFDSTKPYSIYEFNRDFIWPFEKMVAFILNILKGFPVSCLAVCNDSIIDGGNRATTIWLFCHNMFTVSIDGEEYNHDKLLTNLTLVKRWYTCKIPIIKISNASPHDIAQIFENLNKGVRLLYSSDGSVEDSDEEYE